MPAAHSDREPDLRKQIRGRSNYLTGAAAEELAAHHYLRAGWQILERRWRQARGEIDLIARQDSTIALVEVKCASCTDAAIASLHPGQLARICALGEIYVGGDPDLAQCDMRVDLVAIDRFGGITVVENLPLW